MILILWLLFSGLAFAELPTNWLLNASDALKSAQGE
jgi:hypothetical protein